MTDQEIFDQTKKLIHENMIKGHKENGESFHYTKPALKRYPFQFFWDTCFHVFILSALGEHNMAKKHINSLLALQKDDGFVGHMIYWDRLKPGRITDFFQSKPSFNFFFKSHMSSLIQPPLIAQAVKRIYKLSDDKPFLNQVLPKLKKYYRWLASNRDFQKDGLITIISPFESGIDWKPTYDVALGFRKKLADWRLFLKVVWVDFRNYMNGYNLKKIFNRGYFIVKDVGVNTIYAQNLYALAELCKAVDDPDANEFKKLGDKVTESIIQVMYDEKDAAFYDVYGKNNKKIKVSTPTILYPVVIKSMPLEISQKVLKTHFHNKEEFNVRYPLPSVSIKEQSFNPVSSIFIWRGPTWVMHNWFMHQFLLESGYTKESTKLLKSVKQLIHKSGFREYYNPFTGEGYGAKDFTWAGLVVDMMKMEKDFQKSENLGRKHGGN